MLFRFYFQFIAGAIVILAILFWGDEGVKSLAIFALLPLIMRFLGYNKLDERELQLFYKIGNYSLIIVIAAIWIISNNSMQEINGNIIGENWASLSIASLLFGQGLVGLYLYYRES